MIIIFKKGKSIDPCLTEDQSKKVFVDNLAFTRFEQLSDYGKTLVFRC